MNYSLDGGNVGAPDRAWNVRMGEIDRRAGVDPPGRLAALVWQARARVALGRGDVTAAKELAGRGAQLVGFSARAREAQRELEIAD